ncbi:MAG: hypothetical protein IJQ66_01155 [Clostridia bacterium]|nr:hypothetical protein [Clostridia bacterium]
MIENLLKYQEKDAELRKIELELAGSDARKKAISAKKYLESVDESINMLDVKAAELAHIYEKMEEESKTLTEQREEFVGAMEHAEDEEALNYLIKKADELYKKIKTLVQEASRVADAMQSVYKEYAGIRANIKNAQAQYNENAQVYATLKNSKQEERTKIESELKELEKKVDAKLMERYKAKRNNKVFPIVYAVRGNVCGSCNMELPKSVLSQLKNGELIECDQCGKLLYIEK